MTLDYELTIRPRGAAVDDDYDAELICLELNSNLCSGGSVRILVQLSSAALKVREETGAMNARIASSSVDRGVRT